MAGLVHLYCGEGKGKSTAAAGLALRAAGAGKRVIYAQFFKDGSSSEIGPLGRLPEVTVCVCPTRFGLYRRMTEEKKAEAAAAYRALFAEAAEKAGEADLLVLDEAVSACNHGILEEEALLGFLRTRPEKLEVVLTGRAPSQALLDAADYITEMVKRRHPFDRGIPARKGIEF